MLPYTWVNGYWNLPDFIVYLRSWNHIQRSVFLIDSNDLNRVEEQLLKAMIVKDVRQ